MMVESRPALTGDADDESGRHMRILTGALILAPVGGIELSTFQDGAELVERGHDIEVHFQIDGPQRAEYERVGMRLRGPFDFIVQGRRVVRAARGFLPSALAARRFRPDIFWLNRSEHILWGQFVAAIARVPLVCHLHHAPNFRRTDLLYRGVEHFIAVSEHTRQQWVGRGIPADRISVVHNSIELEDYPLGGLDERAAARAALDLPSDRPVALYFGRLTREKGVHTLIESWKRMREPGATLLLVGRRGDGDEWLDAALAELPDGSWRMFPEQSDVVPFLHAADVVAVPTPEHEAFGRVVIEAMATGRPVVGTRVGGIPEILTGPFARFLVEPEDPDALALRLAEVLDWRQDDPGLGERSHAWVAERFPYSSHVDALEAVLRRHARGASVPPSGHAGRRDRPTR